MKKKIRKLTPKQAEKLLQGADSRFCPGVDERLARMVVAAMERKIRVHYLRVNPQTLVPHIPEALERAKSSLLDEPSLRESVLRDLLDGTAGAILVYRNEGGELCSFDDYVLLAVAQDAKIQTVRAVVLGEGRDWFKMKESPIRIGP